MTMEMAKAVEIVVERVIGRYTRCRCTMFTLLGSAELQLGVTPELVTLNRGNSAPGDFFFNIHVHMNLMFTKYFSFHRHVPSFLEYDNTEGVQSKQNSTE
ncbi:hypothetical protein EVAR_5617_1 [Eumeta japonica]|uniref:Uncharacterized protein n=1 Tax=Eumeta variegata TaxID=151549 RepID=A0A4C1T7X3_EUMVA|nr:hypothetical protein EVAR_5617_1 [Eumeta japonica]